VVAAGELIAGAGIAASERAACAGGETATAEVPATLAEIVGAHCDSGAMLISGGPLARTCEPAHSTLARRAPAELGQGSYEVGCPAAVTVPASAGPRFRISR